MFVYLLLDLIFARNFAILVNTSKGYFNYRHAANIQLFYDVLMRNGFKEEMIIPISIEDPIENPRNIFPNKIFIENKIYKHYKMPPVKFDLDRLFNVLILNDQRLFDIDENDNIFIYLTGHGNTEFLKLYNRHYLFKNDILRILKRLCSRVGKVFMILDTCKAESLILRSEVPDNGCVLTTSLEEEFSYSIEVDKKVGISTVDEFAYLFHKMDFKMDKMLSELFSEMNQRGLDSHLTFDENKTFKIADFFFPAEERKYSIQPFKI